MNFKALIKKVFTNACVYFSIITAIYSVIVMIKYVDDTLVLLDATRVLLFFLASILFAFANGVLKLEKLHGAVKILIHYFISLFAFYACMMLPISPEGSTLLVGILLFSVVYFVIMALVALFRSRYRSRLDQKSDYKPQFKK